MSTRISWTDETWNPIRARLKEPIERLTVLDDGRKIVKKVQPWGYHCERISPGCQHCYACTMNGRMLPSWGTGLDYTVPNRDKVEIFLDEKELLKPLSWKKPRRVFPCSMTDLFAPFVPDEMIDRMFAVMALTPQHTFQVLTKRADRMERYVLSRPDSMDIYRHAMWFSIATKRNQRVGESTRLPLRNVWLGVSVEDQKRADERIPHLLRTPAAVRFLSCEPLLEDLQLWKLRSPDYHNNTIGYETYPLAGIQAMPDCDWPHPKIDWVIAGAESGPGARSFDLAWARDLMDQCKSAGTAFFMKQLGSCAINTGYEHWGHRMRIGDANREYNRYIRVKLKDRAGADPSEWPQDLRVQQFPEVTLG